MEHDYDVFDIDDMGETNRDRWLDDYMISNDGPLSRLVYDVGLVVVEKEDRKRARRPQDHTSFLNSIDCIVSNMAHVCLETEASIGLTVVRSKSVHRHYANKDVPLKTFVYCLDWLERLGFLTQTIGEWHHESSTILPTTTFRRMVHTYGISFECFGDNKNRPLLRLRRTLKVGPARKNKKEPVKYPRSLETYGLVAQIDSLNTYLSDADISHVYQEGGPRVDTSRRTLVRYFTILRGQELRFDQGGRLFGTAFWLYLPSRYRAGIRIDGEPVADLDFKNLGPRLAYAKLGQEPPPDDLYDLTGLLRDYDHTNPEHRKAIKQGMASCFNGGAAGSPPILAKLSKGTKAIDIRNAILKKHPAFGDFLDTSRHPVGYEIMFMESQILLCALEKLKALNVVALPQHDGLMVKSSMKQIAQEALGAASSEIVGTTLPVELKADYGHPRATEGLLAAR